MQNSVTRKGAALLLDLIEADGVDCVFASPIAVMAPIWEELAGRSNSLRLRYFRCRHELLAVSAAQGYYQVTGRPQVAFLPTNLGVQNGSMALRTAFQDHVPMVAISIDSLTWGEDPNSDPGPEWPSLLSHAAGPARSGATVVKWAKEARTPSDLANEWRRALYVAQAVPRGPTLLEIPFDLLLAEAHPIQPPPLPPAKVVAPQEEVAAIARLLSQAKNPLITTEYAGRTREQQAALVGLAERLGAPVYEFMMPTFRNIPRDHPLYGLGPIEAEVGEADVILVAGSNAPWHPPLQDLRPGAAVIHLAEDPLRPRAPYWGYATTHTLAGDVGSNLLALAEAIAQPSDAPARTRRWQARFAEQRAAMERESEEASAAAEGRVAAADLFKALNKALPDEAVAVDEIVSQVPLYLHHLFDGKAIQQVRGWQGALGTSLGMALGVKAALPAKTVVCILGDGAWHYNPVPAALGFSQEYGLPLLIVVCNNGQYNSQTWNILRYYPEGAAVGGGTFVGNVIDPMPDYYKAADGYGGAGERVSNRAGLDEAIQRGLASQAAGHSYILDVLVEP
ncbi:MAG: thiamine pyrophosphate-binding protein [Pseudomonadota bacterium]